MGIAETSCIQSAERSCCICIPTSYVDNLRYCIASSGENPVAIICHEEEETYNTSISAGHMAKAILRTEDPRFGRSPGEHAVRALGKSLGPYLWTPAGNDEQHDAGQDGNQAQSKVVVRGVCSRALSNGGQRSRPLTAR